MRKKRGSRNGDSVSFETGAGTEGELIMTVILSVSTAKLNPHSVYGLGTF